MVAGEEVELSRAGLLWKLWLSSVAKELRESHRET